MPRCAPELPEIIARHEHEPAPTPVAWADWNGWPLAHLTLSGSQNGKSAPNERHLIVTIPPQEPVEGKQEMAARKEGDLIHEAKLDREEHLLAKLRERRQSPLQPWEGVLYPIHREIYLDLLQSLYPEQSITMPTAMQRLAKDIQSPGPHQQPVCVVLMDKHFTVTGFADWAPETSQQTLPVIKAQDAFALVAGAPWCREHGLNVGDRLPLNTPLTTQAAADIVARAQARKD